MWYSSYSVQKLSTQYHVKFEGAKHILKKSTNCKTQKQIQFSVSIWWEKLHKVLSFNEISCIMQSGGFTLPKYVHLSTRAVYTVKNQFQYTGSYSMTQHAMVLYSSYSVQ